MNDQLTQFIQNKIEELNKLQQQQNMLIANINPQLSEINTIGGQIREIQNTVNALLALSADSPPDEKPKTENTSQVTE